MVTSLILVRHAAAELKELNEPRIPGPSLTVEGKNQAKKTALFLEGASFSKIYASKMSRAIETAKIISDKEIVLSDELNEFNKIVFEQQSDDVDKLNENIEVALKSKDFFVELLRQNRDSKLLLITHGNVIRYMVCHFLKLKPHKAPNFFMDNASITHLFFDGEELVSVGCINSTTHLFLKE